MAGNVASTLAAPPTYPRSQVFATIQGNYIAVEQVIVGALASGDNTVDLPDAIVKSPLAIIPITVPDKVTMVVSAWSYNSVSKLYEVVLTAGNTAANGCTLLLLVPASG